ncbi:MAG: SH3 domain-containing protein [Spirochaetales bacterium]|nr:SH3 domain-containing protein [Spirochaetales bacterium]
MKKLNIIVLLMLGFSAFAEVNYSDYSVIPMRGSVDGYETPGFYLNIPHPVQSFGNWGDYWSIAQILEVSSTAYTRGDKTAPFVRIRTRDGYETWVYGGDVIVVSTDMETKKGWYYNRDSGHKYMQIFYLDEQFHFITSGSSNVRFNTDSGTSSSPWNFTVNSDSGWTSLILWDKAEGNFFYGSKRPANSENEEWDYESNYSFNLDLLDIDKIVYPEDEWFWHFYAEKNYEAILDLKARGYNKYDNPNLSPGSSPFFESIANRDFEMINFLIDHGFSQTVDGGNYDATVSCLWDLIKKNDLEMIKFLLDAGIEKNTGGELGISWDINYVIRYATPQMLRLFIDGGYDVSHPTYSYSNGEDSGGSGSFLFSAIYNDKVEMAKVLIENGANVNFLSHQYGFGKFSTRTPLETAKSSEMQELLISYGARSSHELTPEDYQTQGLGLRGKMNDTRVRLRERPTLEGKILSVLEEDENLVIIESFDPEEENPSPWPWYLVRREDGEFGWVYGEFVDISRSFIKY